MSGVGIYIKIALAELRSQLEYPVNAIIGFINQFLVLFLEFVAMAALFDRFGAIQGWTFSEVFLSYGIVNLAFSVSESFMRGFESNFVSLVRRGEYDRYLLRPRSTILQISAYSFQFVRLGRVFQSLVVFIIGVLLNASKITGFAWVVLAYTAIAGCTLYFALYIITGILTFKALQPLEFMSVFVQGSVSTMQYPMTIFPKWVRNMFTYILPVATVSYYPIAAIMGKTIPFSPVVAYVLPIICPIFFMISILVFHAVEKTYTSSGS